MTLDEHGWADVKDLIAPLDSKRNGVWLPKYVPAEYLEMQTDY